SLMVSTIAEQAARAIGADHIKARVCALYHDIGKLNQAAYFIENSNGVDMHAELSPSMSAIVILNHVKRGLELAAKYKLKKPLREAIAQHHGNSVVLFFYRLAEVEAKRNGTTVNQSEFCYDGPRPTSKENCIIMLSDCCEAASRSLQNPSKETVEHLVSSIISGKIKDGQLGDSTLSMQELGLIRNSITQTLVSMSHNRISYPKDNKEEKNEDDLFVAAGKGNISPSGTEKI
ncbi:MAG: HDIG domain-containing protein, partial [Lentisphaeria bacterium]|nr:HDIG domain-containing protein [Lentisphaeria bacterium]